MLSFSIGTKVAFREEMVGKFLDETYGTDENLRQYRNLVMAGADQFGEVAGFLGNLVKVCYPDGWIVPIHPKYLVEYWGTEG